MRGVTDAEALLSELNAMFVPEERKQAIRELFGIDKPESYEAYKFRVWDELHKEEK